MTIEMIFLHFVLFFTDLLCKKNSTVKISVGEKPEAERSAKK